MSPWERRDGFGKVWTLIHEWRSALPHSDIKSADEKRAYSIPEFCWRYGIGRSTAYKLAKEGRLRLVKVGNRTLILHEDAEALLREGA
jgi:excisionase family DNA binding protein